LDLHPHISYQHQMLRFTYYKLTKYVPLKSNEGYDYAKSIALNNASTTLADLCMGRAEHIKCKDLRTTN